MGYYGPFPDTISAYYTDGTDKWFGEAARGSKTSTSSWKIFQMNYTGSNWVILHPVDTTTGLASNAPKFKWDDVATYTYQELGT